MKKKMNALGRADDAATLLEWLLVLFVVSILAGTLAFGIYKLLVGISTLLALIAAFIAFLIGIPIGYLAYRLRWFLRGLFN